MRIILAAAALAALTLSGCDINTGPQKAAKAECNCAPPQQAAAATPPPGGDAGYVLPQRHRHHRDYAAAYRVGRSYHWRRDYAEVSVQTYDYRSDSRSYATDNEAGGNEAYVGEAGRRDGGYRATAHGWVDGYGRSHDGEAMARDVAHYDVATGDRARLHPWRGYDVDCPNSR